MAELPNSPPSATARPAARPSGPVFHDGVAKVRITPAGIGNTAEFGGKSFSRDGEAASASSLGWDHADLAAAEADPKLVIERYDKNGNLVKKDGTPYPNVGQLTPKSKMTKAE